MLVCVEPWHLDGILQPVMSLAENLAENFSRAQISTSVGSCQIACSKGNFVKKSEDFSFILVIRKFTKAVFP